MQNNRLIASLNDAQRMAVSAEDKSTLVLAGAGSGKTRVLVHRIAWQIQINGISAHNILAVTFTNKAAKEMRLRIESLLNQPTRAMWIGTFHGLAHRLLRRHAEKVNLPASFQVMDSDDQLRMIKRLMKSLDIDEGKWPAKQVQWFINAQKDEGIRARHMPESNDLFENQMQQIYLIYEQLCDQSGLVDFAELLLRSLELLRDNEDILSFYRQRFQQVHVDEFQDTNTIQYAWLRLLTEDKDNLFIVGDDDQSIYAWRGAKIENLQHFRTHYPAHQVIKLEQNYRSSGNILAAANQLINHNDGRMGKNLWTDSGDGDLISLYNAFNEQDEAYFVIEKIKQWLDQGGSRQDIAILYRSNAQSRQFEEKLMSSAIPYHVYGGLRFFERMEIKNALAYLRLVSNSHDDGSFERIINTPPRGIGNRTLEHIRQTARQYQCSLWQASIQLVDAKELTARACNAVKTFISLINQLKLSCDNQELFAQVQQVVESSGLKQLYSKEKSDKGEARIENLEELVNAARMFDFDEDNEANLNELDLFLSHAALEAGDMQADDYEDCVQLMTLHSAKGLEFKIVFLVGMEEGLFPSQQSSHDIMRLEEERRLCYVGITRAMQTLYLTHAESRRLYGKETFPSESRFLREIPNELCQEIRIRANLTQPKIIKTGICSQNSNSPYKLGQQVKHEKFGEGVVLQLEGEGSQEKIQINFHNKGLKWLLLSYAKLETIN